MIRKFYTLLSLFVTLSTTGALADTRLTLLPKCEQEIRAKVQREILDQDETASIDGIKLLYGGSFRGLHYNSAVIVRINNEVEPEDYIAVTEVDRDPVDESIGCSIKYFRSISYGLLPDIF